MINGSLYHSPVEYLFLIVLKILLQQGSDSAKFILMHSF